MPNTLLIVLVLLLGAICGLRAMTGPAVVCWAARLGWLSLGHSPLNFLTNPISLVVFTILAVGELIGDKLPKTPSRITAFPLIARFISGALCGAAVVITAGVSIPLGAIVGGVGAILGAFVGYHIRRAITVRGSVPDLPIALLEDLVAIGGGLFIVSRF
jgi:uncharacterized membrane protein